MASTGLMIVWFLVVLAMIPVCLWLLKRSGLAQAGMGQQLAPIKQVGSHNLAPGQRIVTVEVGEGESRTWLVLGVTAQSITHLHTLAPSAESEQSVPAQPIGGQFAALLRGKLGQ